MLDHLYSSVNKAIEKTWQDIAPDVEVVYGHPAPPNSLPAECLRIYWLDHGSEGERVGQLLAMVQLDIFVPGQQVALALRRAKALNTAFGFDRGAGFGRLGVFDGEALVGEGRITPLERGWLNGPGAERRSQQATDPEQVHLVRTLDISATPYPR